MMNPLEAWAQRVPEASTEEHSEVDSAPLNKIQRALSFSAGPIDPAHNSASKYVIEGFDAHTNPQWVEGENARELVVLFQNGLPAEVGINGISHEILLDILIHKFQGYQAGKFACEENAAALRGFEMARNAIRERVANRIERKVEGTHEA